LKSSWLKACKASFCSRVAAAGAAASSVAAVSAAPEVAADPRLASASESAFISAWRPFGAFVSALRLGVDAASGSLSRRRETAEASVIWPACFEEWIAIDMGNLRPPCKCRPRARALGKSFLSAQSGCP
jgi:hypothetical protein